MNEQEIWKDIKGYEGYYQISNLGRVRSLDRFINNEKYKGFKKGKIMNQHINGGGYFVLKLNTNKIKKQKFVHKLVAEAFIPNSNIERTQVNHIDHNKLNNNLSNLEWCTHSENMQKALDFYDKHRKPILCKNKDCENKAYRKDKQCRECFKKNIDLQIIKSVKSKKVKKEELIELLKNNSMLGIGKMFDLSDNAIRKWCKSYNIPPNKEELKIYLSNLED